MSDIGHSTAGRGRTLVVDDSRVVRRLIADTLRLAGFSVDEAENGLQALALLDQHEYDVVLTDLRMPEMDGFALLETIRQRELPPEVIVVTGSFGQDLSCAVRALRLGAHDYLVKTPARPEEVVMTVERAIDKKRLKAANAALVEQLRSLSRTDALTGALNRRAFTEAVMREQARASRYGLSLSLLLFDLDNFKVINDTYGHAAGDEVLKLFVQRAQALFRDCDAVFRVGGEEFAVLLPHTDLEGGQRAAERLGATIARTNIAFGPHALRVTVSAGVATGLGTELDGLDLMAVADEALYRAKRGGRNRVCLAGPPARLLKLLPAASA